MSRKNKNGIIQFKLVELDENDDEVYVPVLYFDKESII